MLCKLFKPILLGCGVLLLFGCATISDPKNTYLAKVGDQYISEQEFVEALDSDSKKNYFVFRKQNIDKMIAQKLLEEEAKAQNKSFTQFLNDEVFSKVTIPQKELHEYYHKNKKMFKGKTSVQWEPDVKQILKNQKSQILVKQLLKQLVAKARIEYFIAPQLEDPSAQERTVAKGGKESGSVKQ